ncbi:hypothetical protein HYS94_04630 [Candidatus Daviesbacteria bacterium]|nr:hypothetical protein [Candidatus Daviesbacteria bacterium]
MAKRLLASFLQGIDVNPVKRGAKGHDLFPTIRRVRQAIIKGNLVGIFIQETRHKDGSLDDLLDGPAIFAKMFPNIPIYAARITPPSHRPHIFRIDQPFTYSEVANDSSNNIESISDMTSFIGRRIASLAV